MRTYKFRTYPSVNQVKALNQTLNLCRELYNAMLQQRIYAYRLGKKVNYNSQQDELPGLKYSLPEYRDMHSQVLQDVARRLDRAYDNFYRRTMDKKSGKNIKVGFPRFKSKTGYSSITYTQSGFRILDNGHVWLSKIGEIRMFMHRPVTGTIKTLSVKRDSVGDWFITIVTDGITHENEGNKYALPESEGVTNPIGFDLGLNSIITGSDGLQVDPPRFLRKSEKKLKRAQRDLSRKKKGSGKREKSLNKVRKVHRKISRQRDDFSHKLSNDILEEHDFIAFEDLNISGMVKNHHLAKSILDASWDTIVQYTKYKAESAGKIVLFVDPKHTSQKCSRCGNIKSDLTLSDRIYHCDVCGLNIDRDINAAINIMSEGLKQIGRGTPEFTPAEIGALPAMATPVAETGSPLH